MQDKIDWYQEVVDLEPSSKLFFPLAKMLADQDVSRAVKTLQQGLDRHPEFIEARLFFVELLHKHREKEDYFSRLETQLTIVSPMLKRYAGFWQAWGTTLSQKNKNTEQGIAVSFMGALLENTTLSMSDIFSAGLKAVLGQSEAAASTAQPAKIGLNLQEDRVNNEYDDLTNDDELVSKFVHHLSNDDISEPLPKESKDEVNKENIEAVQEECTEINDTESNNEIEDSADLDTITENMDCEKTSTSDFAALAVKNVSKKPKISLKVVNFSSQSTAHEASESTNDIDVGEEMHSEESDEQFSLRTRSMAEVLAEQGDYVAALKIYSDLMHAAQTDEEKSDLQSRIATLSGLSDDTSIDKVNTPIAPSEANVAKAISPGKERVISVLESLADRLENRVL